MEDSRLVSRKRREKFAAQDRQGADGPHEDIAQAAERAAVGLKEWREEAARPLIVARMIAARIRTRRLEEEPSLPPKHRPQRNENRRDGRENAKPDDDALTVGPRGRRRSLLPHHADEPAIGAVA